MQHTDPSNQRARESNKSHCIRMPRKSKGDRFLSSLANIDQQLHEDFPVPFHLRIKLELMKYIRLPFHQSRARTKRNNEYHRKDRINESLIDAIYFCRSCSQSCPTDRLFTRYSVTRYSLIFERLSPLSNSPNATLRYKHYKRRNH